MQVHIFTSDGVYSSAFLKIIEKEPRILEHYFVFRKKTRIFSAPPPSSLVKRISYSTNIFSLTFRTLPMLYKAKWIYFHYLPYGPSLLIWSILPKVIRKSTWIIWGGDVSINRDKNKSFINQLYEILRKVLIPKFKEIASFIEEDSIEAMKIYKFNPKYNQILYPIPFDHECYENFTKTENQPYVSILIGNSGDPSNFHLEALSMVERFKSKNIKVFCPLSYYYDYQYINKVIKYGYMVLGEVFTPMTELLPVKEYSYFLTKIDIAIMNHNRQQGLGNILPLLYLGKKIYLRNDISTFRFLKNIGCVINSVDEIKNLSFQKFIEIGSDQTSINRQLISLITSEDYCFNLWHQLFIHHYND